MKPQSAPNGPGNTEWERFDNAVRKVFSVPTETIQKEKTGIERRRVKKKMAKGQFPNIGDSSLSCHLKRGPFALSFQISYCLNLTKF